MKRVILPSSFFILVFSFCIVAWAGENTVQILRLTLDDALKIAIINNFDIQLAKYDRAISEADIDDVLSIYDTVLKLEAEYTHDELERTSVLTGRVSEDYEVGLNLSKKLITGTDVEIDYNFLRHRTDSSYVAINPSEESYVKFTFTQPLLKNILGINDWGDVKITKINVDNFRSETLDKIERALSEVEAAYWELLFKEQLVLIREDMQKKAEEFYDIVKAKEELGSAELTDLYAAKANKKLRESELLVEKANLKAAQNRLKLLMNNKEAASSVYISPVDTVDISNNDIQLIPTLKSAFENRRNYKRAMDDIKAKNIKLAMKKNERWPQLDLEGSFKMNGVRRSLAGSIEDTLNEANTEYFAGATFSFPLEGREAKSAYKKAQNEKAKALVNLKKIEKTIVSEIDNKVKIVNAYRERANEFTEVAELQKYKLQEEEKKYRYGRSDSDRIIRFQEDYLNSEIASSQAMLDYVEALIDLYLAENVYLEERNLTLQ